MKITDPFTLKVGDEVVSVISGNKFKVSENDQDDSPEEYPLQVRPESPCTSEGDTITLCGRVLVQSMFPRYIPLQMAVELGYCKSGPIKWEGEANFIADYDRDGSTVGSTYSVEIPKKIFEACRKSPPEKKFKVTVEEIE